MNPKTTSPRNRVSAVATLLASLLCIGWADNWTGIEQKAATVETVRAEFVQEKHLEILTRPLVSTGSICFKPPGSLRWEYTGPIQSILLMHDGKAERFVKTDDGFVRDESARLEIMRTVMDEIVMWMGGKFQDNPDFEASLQPGPKIVLTPLQKTLAEILERIELTLSPNPGIIETVVIHETETSFTKLTFKGAKLNEPLEDAIFEKID